MQTHRQTNLFLLSMKEPTVITWHILRSKGKYLYRINVLKNTNDLEIKLQYFLLGERAMVKQAYSLILCMGITKCLELLCLKTAFYFQRKGFPQK